MATLVLKGYFIKVNKYGRLKFRYIGGSDDTTSRLVTATGDILGRLYKEYAKRRLLDIDSDECGKIDESKNNECDDTIAGIDTTNITRGDNIHFPFDDSTFTVVMPKWIKKPPQDILSRVGLICAVEVKALKYDFTSEAKHNAGEHVIGFQLVFSKVVKEIR
jgi:hypothetical protein